MRTCFIYIHIYMRKRFVYDNMFYIYEKAFYIREHVLYMRKRFIYENIFYIHYKKMFYICENCSIYSENVLCIWIVFYILKNIHIYL